MPHLFSLAWPEANFRRGLTARDLTFLSTPFPNAVRFLFPAHRALFSRLPPHPVSTALPPSWTAIALLLLAYLLVLVVTTVVAMRRDPAADPTASSLPVLFKVLTPQARPARPSPLSPAPRPKHAVKVPTSGTDYPGAPYTMWARRLGDLFL